MNILTAKNINKAYAGHDALKDLSVSIPRGGIFGLLGPNGAGKTTFIRIINQIIAPDSGSIYFNEELLNPSHTSFIGYLPEERGLYKRMKVGEQAIYLARLKGMSYSAAQKKLREWFEKMDITPWWNRNVEELSKGMQQKVQFIITLIHKPSLLIFDEPFSGFDPINANILKEEILELKNKGATVIFSTHNMASVEEICDEIMLINKSEKILQGPINNIKETYKRGEFRIECTDWNQELENTISTKCSLLDIKRNTNNFEILIRMPNKLSPSDEILKSLIGQTRIISFQEILPSMNEIFISEVNKNN